MPFCSICSVSVQNKSWIGHLRSNQHKQNNAAEIHSDGIEVISSAFRSRIASYRIVADDLTQGSLDTFLNSIRGKIKLLLDENIQKHTCIKVNFELFSIFLLFKNDTQEVKSQSTKNIPIFYTYNFDTLFEDVTSNLKKKVEEFQERDSGWAFLCTSHLEVNINKYEPLRGSSYIDLPKAIKSKKACLNIKNRDEYCFLWCIVAALHPAKKHPDRVSSYPDFRNVVNTKGMSFPVTFSDISIFEKNNPELRFIIYGLKNSKTIIGPLYKSENQDKEKKTIHLLYLENGAKTHYCLIKDLSRLVRNQITSHHGKLYFCDSCLIFFGSRGEADGHVCGGIATILPEKGSVIKFKNYDRKQDVPFVVYADFESMLETCRDKSEKQPDTSNTTILNRHVPVAFMYHLVCSIDPSYNKCVSYRGKDCVEKFVSAISQDAREVFDILSRNTPIKFDENNADDFRTASVCYICDKPLFGDKVKDHCHLTGRYRGAAHNYCNLKSKVPNFLPVFFHNLAGYDCHLFIKALGETNGHIKIIPKTKENYISFTKFIQISDDKFFALRFVDTFKFLGTGLDKLVDSMKKENLYHLRSYYPDTTQFNLLSRKGVFPYEYINSWERFKEQTLPSKKQFFSTLTNEEISDKDYLHAKSVWSEFDIQNLGQYTDLYLKTDVLLLTDVFEQFRTTCKRDFDLDPAFYLTAPSLSFDAMLLKTGVELELLSDLSMVRMIQSGIRGGVCMCSQRHAKANNKYMSDYNPQESDSFIVYTDCVNLYGYSMCHAMPHSDFKFLTQNEIDVLNVENVQDDNEIGYFLEVDLEYPKHLHHNHNDLPFCPEKCIPPGGKHSKLIPNLYDKYKYVMHYVHLKKCLKHGLKLRKIHRAISFRQGPFLKNYIDLCTKLRQQAQSTFEQDLYKLFINSNFGKTMENNEKRVNVYLVNQWSDNENTTNKKKTADKLIARPNFHSVSIFSENLVAIQLRPERVILDKPLYIGFSVLEISKAHMYDFHYSVFKPFYKNRLSMCYTDTDSLIYHIETHDFYEDLKEHFMNYFDTSNFSPSNIYNIPLANKKVPGLFKDELGGKIIHEFVGLRSKLYCVKTDESEIKRAKGIKRCCVRDLNVADYKNTLLTGDVVLKKNILFKSIKHDIYTRSVNKVALSRNDDKRLISSSDLISTKAWGHIDILSI